MIAYNNNQIFEIKGIKKSSSESLLIYGVSDSILFSGSEEVVNSVFNHLLNIMITGIPNAIDINEILFGTSLVIHTDNCKCGYNSEREIQYHGKTDKIK